MLLEDLDILLLNLDNLLVGIELCIHNLDSRLDVKRLALIVVGDKLHLLAHATNLTLVALIYVIQAFLIQKNSLIQY